MSDTLVDTNVLIDVANEDPRWLAWSSRRLAEAADAGVLVINQIVYSELAAGYASREQLDTAITPQRFRREGIPWDAAFMAGLAFLRYRRAGGRRPSPLPDFYIGAHALVAGLPVITRDAARYRTYFPEVELVAPD